MNSKKTKNKFIIIALVCLITISSVWAGRTYAYFTASNNASGTITMGTLKVNDFGELNAETNLKVVPNQTVTKTFKATIESDIKYYKRLSLSAEVKAETGKSHSTSCADYVKNNTSILDVTINNFTEYVADGETYYYDLTPVTPTNATTEEEFTITIAVHDWVGAGGCDYYMGATINIGVKVEVIQADYLEDRGMADLTTFASIAELHTVWGGVMGALPYTRVNADGVKNVNGKYVLFGYYPKTLKADNVTVGSTADSDGYYIGSDGYRYAKATSLAKFDYSTKFSDGTTVAVNTEYYFKVEQIMWRILTTGNGKALLLAEDVIDGHRYYETADGSTRTIDGVTVYENNYKESEMRAWLNGYSYTGESGAVSTFIDNGFLQTAFTEEQQARIQTTTVNNSLASTLDSSNSYVCANTNDKVFLLSLQELTNTSYGFSSSTTRDSARNKTFTDYAKSQVSVYNAILASRTPSFEDADNIRVSFGGYISIQTSRFSLDVSVSDPVAPAMWITL